LVSAAGRHGAQAVAEFQHAVRRAGVVLSPLGEPLVALDFIEHRWVAGHREEAYSDWLQWVLSQIEPREVLRVLGVSKPRMLRACGDCPHTVTRERKVPHGHEGSTGRLDLEIRFGDRGLLVVEVKLTSAEDADTAKHRGYRRSLEAENAALPFRAYVVLVLEAADEEYDGFEPWLWADACLELRLVAVRLCKRREHLKAAMTLAFVAAVEQNLLGFCPAGHVVRNGVAAALSLPRITEHLIRFVEATENGEEIRE